MASGTCAEQIRPPKTGNPDWRVLTAHVEGGRAQLQNSFLMLFPGPSSRRWTLKGGERVGEALPELPCAQYYLCAM